ncbi:restriction endonuclease subunit S [Helicobacter sp. MIT 14-3879]|uniref:restriction endonuclease subunit S n=1 Tax=Helicobacter sp. MIT 14-3879 TaxID=2040649 RepID=UPI000E1E4966|nr:restriction endonuclease subunit S [Helicobacter sp. MIT 14-3879]RDU58909.1 hypothetical protein CQA44_11915 [Helicobacter sp. MIT 14-3879]
MKNEEHTKSPTTINTIEKSNFQNTFTPPFEIPQSWVWVRLGEVCEIVLGKTPKREIIEYWKPNDYHWVSIGDMLERETITSTKECISQKARQDCFGDSITPKGTLLLSFKLTIGKTSFLGFDGFYNEGIVSIIPKIYRDVSVLPQHEKANYHSGALAEEAQKDTIFKNFLLYFLPIFTNLCEKTGAIKGETLNKEKLIHLPIPLPPLQEQKEIVATLDSLFTLTKGLRQKVKVE